MPLTSEQQSRAIQLRVDGLSYARVAKAIGENITEPQVYKFLRTPPPPKPKPLPPPVIVKPKLLPNRPLRSSAPLRKVFNPDLFKNHRAPTKPQLYAMFTEAVRCTAMLRSA